MIKFYRKSNFAERRRKRCAKIEAEEEESATIRRHGSARTSETARRAAEQQMRTL